MAERESKKHRSRRRAALRVAGGSAAPAGPFTPIELAIDVDARRAQLKIDGIVESEGKPIISAFDGSEARSRIHLPNGFEYTYAEMANASTKAQGEIELNLTDSYGQFNILHMNQNGVIR